MKCIICGHRKFQKLKVVNSISIFECKGCKLGMIDQKETKNLSPKYLYDFNQYNKQKNKLLINFNRIAEKINLIKKSGKVLDVGGGYGLFSSILQKNRQYKLTIIEPINSIRYINENGIKVYKNTLESFLGMNIERYDVVIMLDVIEHLKNPYKSLERISKILKKDGIIVIQTPNYDSIMEKLCKNWSWWMIEDHKYFFSPKSLALLTKKAGLKTVLSTTFEDLFDFKKNLDGNFTKYKIPIIRKMIKTFYYVPFFIFYILTRKIFWSIGKGGLILSIATKKYDRY